MACAKSLVPRLCGCGERLARETIDDRHTSVDFLGRLHIQKLCVTIVHLQHVCFISVGKGVARTQAFSPQRSLFVVLLVTNAGVRRPGYKSR